MNSVHHSLNHLQNQGLPRLEAQMLVLHACGQSSSNRAWLLVHDTKTLSGAQDAWLTRAATRRIGGEPMAYLLGTRGFHGLELAVDSRVLDPRPDTETLVDWALTLELPRNARVLDLGTGSGAIALALANARPSWQVHAADVSADALAVATSNAQRLNLPVTFYRGEWLGALPAKALPFDLIVSNPPYIASGDAHLAQLTHEPAIALTSGPDGLDAIRHIVQAAPQHLQHSGWLLLEHGFDQAEAVRSLMGEAGFVQISTHRDIGQNERCTGGHWLQSQLGNTLPIALG